MAGLHILEPLLKTNFDDNEENAHFFKKIFSEFGLHYYEVILEDIHILKIFGNKDKDIAQRDLETVRFALKSQQNLQQKEWLRNVRAKISSSEYAATLHELKYQLITFFKYSPNSGKYKYRENADDQHFKVDWLNVSSDKVIKEDAQIYEHIDEKIKYLEKVGRLKPEQPNKEVIELSEQDEVYFKHIKRYILFLEKTGVLKYLEDKYDLLNNEKKRIELLKRLTRVHTSIPNETIKRYLTGLSTYRRKQKSTFDSSESHVDDEIDKIGLH